MPLRRTPRLMTLNLVWCVLYIEQNPSRLSRCPGKSKHKKRIMKQLLLLKIWWGHFIIDLMCFFMNKLLKVKLPCRDSVCPSVGWLVLSAREQFKVQFFSNLNVRAIQSVDSCRSRTLFHAVFNAPEISKAPFPASIQRHNYFFNAISTL